MHRGHATGTRPSPPPPGRTRTRRRPADPPRQPRATRPCNERIGAVGAIRPGNGAGAGARPAPSDAAGVVLLSFVAGFAGAPLIVWVADCAYARFDGSASA